MQLVITKLGLYHLCFLVNIGGADTRTIFFHTDDGTVYLKRTPSSKFEEIAAQEKKMMQNLTREKEKFSDIH